MNVSQPIKGLCAAVLMVPLAAAVHANGKDPLPRVDPASVGLSAERLARIGTALKTEIEKGVLPGAVVAIARRGKLVYFESFGALDPATKAPMRPDAIFSIASMTKPIVSVGIMMLHEEGKLSIADPIGKYLPQMADMQVADFKTDASGVVTFTTRPAKRQPTIQDLLRHTSGIPYGARGDTPVHKMWPPNSSGAATTYTGAEFLEKIGKLPLVHEPGTVWDYSLAVDVQGLIIEAVTGKRLGVFLAERIFEPLGMVDTSFAVPDTKKDRYAGAYAINPTTGKPQSVLHARTDQPLKFDCGGGCLASTASDYIRFSQMLLNGGVLEGKRLLGTHTVAYMTSDHLGPEVQNKIPTLDASRVGYGFGLGFAVRRQDGISGVDGSRGDYNWGGAYGTYFWNDPKEQLTVVYMAHTPGPGIRQHHRALMHALALQAIVE
jgi:CubicO group peptidase (beta-lactamase class C family)